MFKVIETSEVPKTIKVVKTSEVPEWEAPTHGHRRATLYIERNIAPSKFLAAGNVTFPPYAQKDVGDAHGGEEIYYVLRGKGKFVLDGKEYPIEKGTVIYIGPGVVHQAINTENEIMELYWVISDPEDAFGKPGNWYKNIKTWKQVR